MTAVVVDAVTAVIAATKLKGLRILRRPSSTGGAAFLVLVHLPKFLFISLSLWEGLVRSRKYEGNFSFRNGS